MEQYEQPSQLGGVYQMLISIGIISILIGVALHYGVGLSASVSELKQEKALTEFQYTVMQVRAKWMAKKQSVIRLAIVNEDMEAVGEAVFHVNDFGWPVDTLKQTEQTQCKRLFLNVQSEKEWPQLSARADGQGLTITRCYYSLGKTPWFAFNFNNGAISVD
ncbi:hypothetical protein AAEU32_06480 [Pseudoalteromonas sp. SSDWG2]|uniref:hypothetical protein n=1 Tax=Pseudoalteromonas sp. SSDWG2 TaxID=3139391 RepID=UPI003BA95DA6